MKRQWCVLRKVREANNLPEVKKTIDDRKKQKKMTKSKAVNKNYSEGVSAK